MVAVPQPQPISPQQSSSAGTFELIQGSLSARRAERHSPLLAGLHRVADGGLLGVFAAVLLLSGLTLHWQHRWTLAFRHLELTRSLTHRLTESTAMLERHLLEHSRIPKRMVPTTVANLLYLDKPGAVAPQGEPGPLTGLGSLIEHPIKNGY